MKLYDVPTSPSPRRVRIFIAEKNLTVEKQVVDTANKAHLKPEFLKLNPWATVPILQLDDGTCISEAIACCRYLEEAFPNPPLMGTEPKEKAEIAMWEHRMEWDGFLSVAEYLRNSVDRLENRGLTGPINFKQIPELAARGKKRVEYFFDFLDSRLGESKYVAGDYYTIADITAQVSVDFSSKAGITIPKQRSNILKWHEIVNSRPSASA